MLLTKSALNSCSGHVPCARSTLLPAKPLGCGRPAVTRNSRRLAVAVKAQEQEFGLAPVKPKTPYGEMLQYYLRMEPQLFRAAVDQQLARMKEEKEAKEAAAASDESLDESGTQQRSKSELVLYQRMEEVRAMEVRATLEDLMYVSILEKFLLLRVEMLPRLDGFVDAGPANLVALTEGIHSKEALELVREHMLGVMGAAASAKFSTELIKMSKFQMAQVYAASIMFGYFLRRVDTRFQLESALGVLDERSQEEAVARLERLFAQADDLDTSLDPDVAGPIVDILGSQEEVDSVPSSSSSSSSSSKASSSSSSSKASSSSSSSSSSSRGSSESGSSEGGSRPRGPVRSASSRGRSALRKYIEGFDQATMIDTARVVSAEGAALVERQTTALFGDIKELTQQMQEAVGQDVSSAEELYSRIQRAVQTNAIETVTMTIATQRRCVLEAVAFGTFLRDVETSVNTDYGLLTPLPPPKLPPGAAEDPRMGV